MIRSSPVILFSTGLLILPWLSAGALCCLRSPAAVLQYVARGIMRHPDVKSNSWHGVQCESRSLMLLGSSRQDASLPDLLRLWDSFIGDPMGYELVVYACLASLLSCRASPASRKVFVLMTASALPPPQVTSCWRQTTSSSWQRSCVERRGETSTAFRGM